MRLSLRALSLGGDELRAERVRKARNDLVLHVEEVGHGLIEPFRPEMMAALGVDELDADAHPITRALNAALQHIANVQLAADLTGATPSAEARSRRRNVAQSVLPSVWPVRYPLRRVSGLLGSQRARTLGASAVRVDPPTSLRSVRFSMVHKPEERQRAFSPRE